MATTTSPLSVSSLGQLINGSASQVAPIAMQQTIGNTASNNFQNTGNFQVPYGSLPGQVAGQAQNYAQTNTNNTYGTPFGGVTNPAQLAQNGLNFASQAFTNDPNMQAAVQQGVAGLQNSYAAKGLSQSGALGQAISQNLYNNYLPYMSNALNQYNTGQTNLLGQYNNTMNNSLAQYNATQSGLAGSYSNYQNQLANLTNMGIGANNTNATNQMNAGNTLANILSGANLSTGQNISNANLGTSSNIAQLLVNQGVLGASAYLNTGAAQNNNIFNGMSLAAQMGAQAQASQANTAGAMSSGGGLLNSGGMF